MYISYFVYKTLWVRELDSYAEAVGTYSEAKNLSKTFENPNILGKLGKN